MKKEHLFTMALVFVVLVLFFSNCFYFSGIKIEEVSDTDICDGFSSYNTGTVSQGDTVWNKTTLSSQEGTLVLFSDGKLVYKWEDLTFPVRISIKSTVLYFGYCKKTGEYLFK